ncbi:MAG: triose-phosphate isomerase [Parachlamydiales bacterium]|jgi:triosephosphate isomerase
MAKIKNMPIIAANWKMYKTLAETEKFIEDFIPKVTDSQAHIYIAVPYTSIHTAALKATGSKIIIGAQNMNDASEGAFTGEVSAVMLTDAGARFVLLGHSERRRYFNESNQVINLKVKQALNNGLQPLLCIGETQEEREASETEDVLATQLSECLEGLDEKSLQTLIIAYEPVWAIGTGQTATPEIAQETHLFCREYLTQHWGQELASHIPLLYGGSVKPETAPLLLSQKDINGLLVGGASLQAESFAEIINSVNSQPVDA